MDYCKGCLAPPEECEMCIYSLCKKPIDFKLVKWNYEHRIIFHYEQCHCWIEDKPFYDWFKAYFKYSLTRPNN